MNDYLIDQENNKLDREEIIKVGRYNAIFEKYELNEESIENIIVNLKVIKENIEIYNSNITYTKFGLTGYMDVKSVSPNI